MAAQKEQTSAAQRRKVTKPLMEKRRRARINQCLSELKRFILAAEGEKEGENGRSSKLEKADILEMTVRYLRQINNQLKKTAEDIDSERYQAGYRQCMGEVARFVSVTNPSLTTKFLSHLDHCLMVEGATRETTDNERLLFVSSCGVRPDVICQQKPVPSEMWRPW